MRLKITRYIRGAAAWLLFLAPFLVFPEAAHAQSATGRVSGQVSNAATHSFLEGATVEVAGTNRVAYTDREGRFQLNELPAGQTSLVVRYTGLDPQEITVNVTPGQTTLRDVALTSDIYAMEEFTVAGMREGTALAVTLQRQAPNVKNVVSSDTFGNVADGNIGDFLQRLPGITAVYVGPDVRQVQIRGVNPELNSVTMDGQRVASAQSANLGRAFEFEQASLGLIETIEVTKAPTPDMDADSIGGSVNLVTKSAFDRAARRVFTYTLGFVHRPKYNLGDAAKWKQPIDDFGPSMNFSYSDVIGEKKNIGILLTGTFHSQPGGGTTSLLDYERTADPGAAYVWRARVPRPSGAPRTRLATGVKVDYKWSENTTISLNTMYNWFHENNDTRTHSWQTSRSLAKLDANGNRISGGAINPNYTEDFTEVFAHNNSFSNIAITTNDKSGRTYQFQPMVRHRFDDLSIDYNLTYSSSATYYDHSQNDTHFDSRPRGVVSTRLRNVGFTIDRSDDPIWPVITQTAGLDVYDLGNYSGLRLQQPDRRGYDSIIGGQFNLRKEIDLAVPAFVKTGVSYRQQERETWRNSRRFDYTGPDGIVGSADDDLNQFLDKTGYHEENSTYKGYRSAPWPNPYAVARHQKDYPELWKEDIGFNAVQKLQHRREITESVTAGYLMGNVQIDRFTVLGGFRVEQTDVDGEGPLRYVSPEEKARRAAWTGPVTDSEARRRAEAEWGGRDTGSGSYRKVFPGLHLKYEPFGGLVTRASWSTGIGRPSFGSIIPFTNANDENMTVSVNNTGLQPQYSNNFDASAEYYFEPVGLFSVGVFLKEIEDFIFTDRSQVVGAGPDNGFGGDYEGYQITTQANGGFAQIQGIELNYQQQLSFLPGFWQGFGVYANYTHLKTKGDYGGSSVQSTNEIADFLPKAGNVGVSYAGHGFDVRVQMNWRGKYLDSFSTNRALLLYQQPRTQVNLKSKYAVSDKLAVFLDIENIFDEELTNNYYLYEERNNQFRLAAPKIVAGITGRF